METTDSRRSSSVVRYLAAVARSPDTCRHSSRVGTTISARGMPVRGRSAPEVVIRCSSGTPNAKVLPIPVRAWPIRSSPARASGRVSSWMAKGWLMPSSVSACTISSRTPRSAKVDSDVARVGVINGVMRKTRCLSVLYSVSHSLRSRAHQLTVEYVADSRGPALSRRANCLHAHFAGSGSKDLQPIPVSMIAGGLSGPGIAVRAAIRVAVARAAKPGAAGRHGRLVAIARAAKPGAAGRHGRLVAIARAAKPGAAGRHGRLVAIARAAKPGAAG